MARREWIVSPHDPIQKLEDNLWTIAGQVPGVPMTRRMSIVKRQDGTLAFFQAVPLADDVLDEIRAWGKPRHLVLGHDSHVIDAHAVKTRLGLTAYGPAECMEKLSVKVDVDGPLTAFPEDPTVRLEGVPGSKNGETVMIVRSAGGQRVSLLFTDVIMNLSSAETPWFMRPLFASNNPRVIGPWRWQYMADRKSLKAGIQRWAETPNLVRLVPCHGAIVEANPAGALRGAAEAL